MTVSRELGHIVYSVGEQAISMAAPESILAIVRERRAVAARSASGPWWRMFLVQNTSGEPKIAYDYGEAPFPPGQLFEPDRYPADPAAYPRARVPVWSAACIGHGNRQRRTPGRRANRAGGMWAILAENEFPPFSGDVGAAGRRSPRHSSPPDRNGTAHGTVDRDVRRQCP